VRHHLRGVQPQGAGSALTTVATLATVVPGRARSLQGGVHLVLLAALVFLSIKP
jgi:Ca2+:H+ antiporter